MKHAVLAPCLVSLPGAAPTTEWSVEAGAALVSEPDHLGGKSRRWLALPLLSATYGDRLQAASTMGCAGSHSVAAFAKIARRSTWACSPDWRHLSRSSSSGRALSGACRWRSEGNPASSDVERTMSQGADISIRQPHERGHSTRADSVGWMSPPLRIPIKSINCTHVRDTETDLGDVIEIVRDWKVAVAAFRLTKLSSPSMHTFSPLTGISEPIALTLHRPRDTGQRATAEHWPTAARTRE